MMKNRKSLQKNKINNKKLQKQEAIHQLIVIINHNLWKNLQYKYNNKNRIIQKI